MVSCFHVRDSIVEVRGGLHALTGNQQFSTMATIASTAATGGLVKKEAEFSRRPISPNLDNHLTRDCCVPPGRPDKANFY